MLANRKIQSVLSLLTGAYFLVVILWLLPETPLRQRVIDPIRGFWNYFRLDQNWALFSPRIREVNYHVICVVTFEDGSKCIWQPPLISKMDFLSRFQQDKFRKWDIDCLPWEPYKQFWPDLARYVGRRYYNPDNKPASLSLNLFWVELPPPTVPTVRENLPHHSRFATQFVYRFTAEDFK